MPWGYGRGRGWRRGYGAGHGPGYGYGRGYGPGYGMGRGYGRGMGRVYGPGNPYPYCRYYPDRPRWWWMNPEQYEGPAPADYPQPARQDIGFATRIPAEEELKYLEEDRKELTESLKSLESRIKELEAELKKKK